MTKEEIMNRLEVLEADKEERKVMLTRKSAEMRALIMLMVNAFPYSKPPTGMALERTKKNSPRLYATYIRYQTLLDEEVIKEAELQEIFDEIEELKNKL